MLLFICPIARLPSLAHLEAGMGQLVPLKQTRGEPEKTCHPLLSPALFPHPLSSWGRCGKRFI